MNISRNVEKTNTPCPQKRKPKVFLYLILKAANRISSNFVHSVIDQYQTMWHKTCPAHLTYVCTLPCKVMRLKIVTEIAETRGLR